MIVYNYNNVSLKYNILCISIISPEFDNCIKQCMEAGIIYHNFKMIR